ncbi:spaetzle-processing enzyme-like [Uranotaenia lowii]|uniref:spaetzle-processing enzyme-like n=1 Tax=Uranotaenia lowii TaxID=190385 RepID=UPI00247A3A74|nr:spaetzle-processing enzyme-like [Uranotaenia lowii]XP_055588010.1 spaetzle-processing enzyme-like [Uranotaenia lowii]
MWHRGVFLTIGFVAVAVVHSQNPVPCSIKPRLPGQCVPENQCPHVAIKSAQERQALKCNLGSAQGVCCQPDKVFELDFSQCGYGGGYRAGLSIAEVTEVPWIAILLYRDAKSNKFVEDQCLGALISNQYVLTTARCLNNGKKLASVRLGELKKSTSKDCGKIIKGSYECTETIDVPVESTVIHEGHRSGSDLGLIRLTRKVENSKAVRPICLPIQQNPDKPFGYNFFEVASWYGNSDDLRKEPLAGMGTTECQSKVRGLGISVDSEKHLCTRITNGRCALTESGTPVYQMADMGPHNLRWVLYGIGSLDTSKCSARVPTDGPLLSAKVEHFVPWILENMKS